MKDNEIIEDTLTEESQPAPQPKPLRKLKRVDAGRTSAGGNQEYQGRYGNSPSGEYQGRYGAEPAVPPVREDVRRQPVRRPPVREELNIPIKFIGVGEKAEDLQPFDPEAFAKAIFD